MITKKKRNKRWNLENVLCRDQFAGWQQERSVFPGWQSAQLNKESTGTSHNMATVTFQWKSWSLVVCWPFTHKHVYGWFVKCEHHACTCTVPSALCQQVNIHPYTLICYRFLLFYFLVRIKVACNVIQFTFVYIWLVWLASIALVTILGQMDWLTSGWAVLQQDIGTDRLLKWFS